MGFLYGKVNISKTIAISTPLWGLRLVLNSVQMAIHLGPIWSHFLARVYLHQLQCIRVTGAIYVEPTGDLLYPIRGNFPVHFLLIWN